MSRVSRTLSQLRSALICAGAAGAISIGALTSSVRADEGAEPSAQSLYERGVVERRAGRSDAAMVLLALAAAREPDNADFRLQLALAQMAAKRIDAAERELLRALRLAPGYADAEIALGYIDLYLGRRLQGEARARQLLRRFPERDDVIQLSERARPPVKPARSAVSTGRTIGLRLTRFDGSVSEGRLAVGLALRRDTEAGLSLALVGGGAMSARGFAASCVACPAQAP